MTEKTAIAVEILGQDCQIMCSSPEEELRVQKTATLIRDEVSNIVKEAGVSQVTALLYTALNLGDRLFREIESTENLREQITQGAEQITKLERELHKKQKTKEPAKARGKKESVKENAKVIPETVVEAIQEPLEEAIQEPVPEPAPEPTLNHIEEPTEEVATEAVEDATETVEVATETVEDATETVEDATETVEDATVAVEEEVEAPDTTAPQSVRGLFETMAAYEKESTQSVDLEEQQIKIPDC